MLRRLRRGGWPVCDREEPKCRYKLRCAHTGRWRGSMVILGPFDQHEVHLHHHDLANHNRLYVQSRGKRSFSFLPPDVFSHCDRSRHSVYKMHEPTTCRCNATHAVTYMYDMYARNNAAADVAVYIVGAGDELPSPVDLV